MSADPHSDPGEKYSAPAAACAAEILKYLAQAPEPQSPPEIARAIGRSKSLVFRVLQELMRQEFVGRPAGGNAYGLAFGVLEVGTAFLAKSDFMHSVQAVLRDLARTTEETVNFGVLRGSDVLYLAKHEGRNSVLALSHVGGRVPATCTALGKAILAQVPQRELDVLVPKELPRLTSQSIATRAELTADLERVRERGWAFDDGEAVLGRCCVATQVILRGSGIGAAAISLSMSSGTYAERGDEFRLLLLETSDRLNREAEARYGMRGDGSAAEPESLILSLSGG